MKIVWNDVGERIYETGVDRGVLYPRDLSGLYPKGVGWNGLISVNENPTGAEPTALWADNIKYLNLMSREEFGAAIEAYMYPDEFSECDGSIEISPGVYAGQQNRKPFGFSYRTFVGDDVVGNDLGYKIHLVYNALAAPSSKDRSTINDSPDAVTFSWDLTTTPVPVPNAKPSAQITIDSRKLSTEKLKTLEDFLYGTETTVPQLPLPQKLVELLGEDALG